MMSTVKDIFQIRETPGFSSPGRQSIEQTEDYAFKQVVHTKELIVDGVSISQHTPTSYTGVDFAGVNPNKTLTHSRNLPDSMMLFIGGRFMHPVLEYTKAGAVISMVNVEILDSDNVTVVD